MIFLSSILLIAIGSTAYAYAQGQPSNQFPQSIIAFSNTDTTPHALELKAIQQGDAEPRKVSGFSLDMTNTVSAQINSQVLVFVSIVCTFQRGDRTSCPAYRYTCAVQTEGCLLAAV